MKSTPLLPCSTCWISTSSFPWSCPSQPPAHLHKAQTGGDVTNKPGTHSAGCLLSMNPLPLPRHDEKQKINPPALAINDLFPESKLYSTNKIKGSARLGFEACIPAGDHSDSQVKESKGLKEVRRAFIALSFGQNSPESKYPPPSFFSSSKMVMFTLKHLYCTVAT